MAIIVSILAILAVIVLEVAPLFGRAGAETLASFQVPELKNPLAIGTDEYRELGYAIVPAGIRFFRLKDGSRVSLDHPGPQGEAMVATVSDRGRGSVAVGTSDGRAILTDVGFTVSFSATDARREIAPRLSVLSQTKLDPAGRPIEVLTHYSREGTTVLIGATGPRKLTLVTQRRKKSLVGEGKLVESRRDLELAAAGEIRALLVDNRGDDLFVGTSKGTVQRVDLRDPANPRPAESVEATRNGSEVTVLGFLLGDRTLLVGDQAGGVSSWQLLHPQGAELALVRIYDFTPHPAAVRSISISQRDKGFVTLDQDGGLFIRYGTTGQTLLALQSGALDARAVALTPKSDGVLAAAAGGRFSLWSIDNPHPEVTLKSLFGKVWYEGYEKPEYVWQSTGGTDDFEAKLSLFPIFFGTIKGTIYALLVAVPLALLSALYASQFMHPKIKAYVKPIVEVMAALPSVVLGFIAGLWLAPRLEVILPGLLVLPVAVPLLILLTLGAWRLTPVSFRQHLKHGTEVNLLLPVVLVGFVISFALGTYLDSLFPGGDYRTWIRNALGMSFEQRNSVVVGIAMGFAVVPIIFTITEDSLSNVPRHLTAGSLALGATRWQTALRVVLPTASPGIFSAVMIGFGRAVGETMIVVMATGNTPIMSFSPFNGFRAASANLAVEMPEAAKDGTLYRVLFLTAFLLFLMTFTVNTLAELVRLRLRKRYQAI
jgi:phosphate transport system permease protein